MDGVAYFIRERGRFLVKNGGLQSNDPRLGY